FADTRPLIGSNFYRLKIVDESGKAYYSKTIEIGNNVAGSQNIRLLWPNPFTDNITLAWEANYNQAVSISIADMSGRMVQSQSSVAHAGENKILIGDLARLPAGVYILKVHAGQEPEAKYKVVKL
ncbi:MAG TPA: T9SS type A sorting domain-containing protein, partial [Puia sp.]|nr:T9SS type A sorting domain-containing protein [Puia sp.]